MKKKIITVSREFGSGGRTIGKTVAQRLNIPYYDKELVKQVASTPSSLRSRGSSPPAGTALPTPFWATASPGPWVGCPPLTSCGPSSTG